jgi:hypothetical protein
MSNPAVAAVKGRVERINFTLPVFLYIFFFPSGI